MFGQELVDVLTGFPGEFGVEAAELVTAGGVFVDLVFELPVVCLEGIDEALDLDDVDVFIVGVAVDE